MLYRLLGSPVVNGFRRNTGKLQKVATVVLILSLQVGYNDVSKGRLPQPQGKAAMVVVTESSLRVSKLSKQLCRMAPHNQVRESSATGGHTASQLKLFSVGDSGMTWSNAF